MILVDKNIPVVCVKGSTEEILNDINNVLCGVVKADNENSGIDKKKLLQVYTEALYKTACESLEVEP